MTTRRAAILVAALCGVLLVSAPSYASFGTTLTSPSQMIGSGQWGAAPSATSLDFGTPGVQQLYFTVTNNGTLPLIGATYTVSGTGFKVGMTMSLIACVGGSWNMSTNVCTGGVTQTVVTTTGASSSAAVTAAGLLPTAVGSTVTVQALLSKNPARTTLGSVTVTVDRSQVRAATVTNA